jgi:hypothetical protein
VVTRVLVVNERDELPTIGGLILIVANSPEPVTPPDPVGAPTVKVILLLARLTPESTAVRVEPRVTVGVPT